MIAILDHADLVSSQVDVSLTWLQKRFLFLLAAVPSWLLGLSGTRNCQVRTYPTDPFLLFMTQNPGS